MKIIRVVKVIVIEAEVLLVFVLMVGWINVFFFCNSSWSVSHSHICLQMFNATRNLRSVLVAFDIKFGLCIVFDILYQCTISF